MFLKLSYFKAGLIFEKAEPFGIDVVTRGAGGRMGGGAASSLITACYYKITSN